MDREHEATVVALETTQGYVGQWNRLVSTTNWQKGRIIHQWRAALMRAGAAATEYSDETWSRMVGGVTGQHAGRLRRVYERFGDVHTQYEGLFWSHFQASLDWEDAEMWLEGAVQNNWSVAAMRRQRWETMGHVAGDEPDNNDLIVSELDEDFVDTGTAASRDTHDLDADNLVAEDYTVDARSPAGLDYSGEAEVPDRSHAVEDAELESRSVRRKTADEPLRPFADLPQLPADLSDAFEAFQLAILRHKAAGWQEVSLADVLFSLDALKALALAPAE
jgi:hypothetical protein